MDEPRGWYSRGYLPHLDVGSAPQFLTWCQEDSISAKLIRQWRAELAGEARPQARLELLRLIESNLDRGSGSCLLRKPEVASIVRETLLLHHHRMYELHEWVIMPNHVHCLLTPASGVSLGKLIHANKSYTASAINKLLGRNGRFWQVEYFDRLIRNNDHFEKTAIYIRRNPFKAGLCDEPGSWTFGSAYQEPN